MQKSKRNFSLAERKALNKNNCTTNVATCSPSINNNEPSSGDDDDDSEDWVDMEKIDDLVEAPDLGKSVQVTIKRPKSEVVKKQETEAEKWEKEVRLEIARRRRELFEDFHKVCFLVYKLKK